MFDFIRKALTTRGYRTGGIADEGFILNSNVSPRLSMDKMAGKILRKIKAVPEFDNLKAKSVTVKIMVDKERIFEGVEKLKHGESSI